MGSARRPRRLGAPSRLSAFGSVLREDFRADSDLVLLVEFEAGRTSGFGFFSLQEELTRLFGSRVDLNTRLVEIVGEAASRVSVDVQGRHPELPWREAIGVR